jgi:hypothetical protein
VQERSGSDALIAMSNNHALGDAFLIIRIAKQTVPSFPYQFNRIAAFPGNNGGKATRNGFQKRKWPRVAIA